MARRTRPVITEFNEKEYYESGRNYPVKSYSGGSVHLKNLKKRNRNAWQNDIFEICIDNKCTRLNQEDFKRALTFM